MRFVSLDAYGGRRVALTGIGERKRQLGRPRRRRGYNIKMDHQEVRCDMDWIELVQLRTYSGLVLTRKGILFP
jgi:hypothetical protein